MIIDDVKEKYHPKWVELVKDSQLLLQEASEKFLPIQNLVTYLESLLEESKEERKGHGDPKMISRDFQNLKEFVTKMTSHIDVQMRENYIKKKAREILAEVDNLQVCSKALNSFQYFRSINLEMIADQFQSVIDNTASKAPDYFTKENISDLY